METVQAIPTDEALARDARTGNEEAFALLVKRYEPRLYRYIRRMIGQAADAEDLFQDTFLKVYTHLNSFQDNRPFQPWVYRIATNTCRDYARRQRLRRMLSLDFRAETEAAPLSDRIASGTLNPRDKAREAEQDDSLAQAVAQMPLKQRSVFLMARYEGLSYAEIAASLEIPVGTVKSRMNTAVNTLLQVMEDSA